MKEPGAVKAISWWLAWIALTIIAFFVSCFIWTGHIARHVGPIDRPGVAVLWVAAVFGTWMALLVPLIIVMYRKVDKAYEDARITRESDGYRRVKEAIGVRCVSLDASRRRLKRELSEKLRRSPETLKRGHLVTAVLSDGRRIPNVFVLDRSDVLGVYDAQRLVFEPSQIVDVEPVPGEAPLPAFKEERWLRLDGVGAPVDA